MRRSKKSPTTLIGIVTILVLLALAYWIKVHKNRISAAEESESNVMIPEEQASTQEASEAEEIHPPTPQSELEAMLPEYATPASAQEAPAAMPESGEAPLFPEEPEAEAPKPKEFSYEDTETAKDKSMLEELLTKVRELPTAERRLVLDELAPKQELRTYMDKEDLRDVCRAIEAEREALNVYEDPEASSVEPA